MKTKNPVLLILISLIFSCSTGTPEKDVEQIKDVMNMQQAAWNNYDLEGFMEGYWKNDSLKFYGKNGVTYGWENTLNNYKKRYPGKDHTGTLKFTLDEISPIGKESYYIMGQYHLNREVGEANGVFLIIFRKINGEWKIIADLSC